MQTTFDTLSNRLECHNVPRLPRKTTCQPALTASKRIGFAASHIDTARLEENQRLETRHQNEHFVRDVLQFSQFVASESTFSDEFSHEPQNLRPQNRCFVRGFRHFSSHLTKCHACQGICTLSPLHAALTMLFANTLKNTQLDTSKVLRLPREMTMEVAKMLRLPRKLQPIF